MRIKIYLAITFILMMMFSGTALADTITVDDDPGMNYQKIQDAINAASDSDTILVYNGTYTENVDVNKSVTIISESGNPDDTKVQAAATNDHVFHVTRDNVTISGFNITNATSSPNRGLYLDGVQDNNISNNEVSNNYKGIYLKDSSNNTLINNTVSNTNSDGIELSYSNNNALTNNNAIYIDDDGIYLSRSNNNTLNNNNASNNDFEGIELSYSNNNALNNNNVSNNDFSGFRLYYSSNNTLISNNAVYIDDDGIYLYYSSNNTLINNNASKNNKYGIHLREFNNNNTLTNNNVLNNKLNGIYLRKSSDNKLINNKALNNDDDGIDLFDSSNNNILTYNNALYNVDNGITIYSSSNNNTLTKNNALYNGGNGIQLSGSINNKIDYNNASNNSNNGFNLYSSRNNTLTKNNASNNSDNGIRIYYSSNNILSGNLICYNDEYGIKFYDSDDNTIYDNFFNNTNNIEIDTIISTDNIWNVTNTSGPNIVNGPYIGGNYWAHPDRNGFSQTCTDTNNDGFCDEEFNIAENNNDSLPLTINASVDIEKYTNGEDADEPEGPTIQMGSQVTWTYNVTNTGSVILYNITVTDDKLGEISCPNSTLKPGESMVCTKTGSAQSGQYSNLGNVTAEYKDNLCAEIPTSQVSDSDPGHYFGYDHWAGVPTANPVLMIGVLGIAILLFLRREQK